MKSVLKIEKVPFMYARGIIVGYEASGKKFKYRIRHVGKVTEAEIERLKDIGIIYKKGYEIPAWLSDNVTLYIF